MKISLMDSMCHTNWKKVQVNASADLIILAQVDKKPRRYHSNIDQAGIDIHPSFIAFCA